LRAFLIAKCRLEFTGFRDHSTAAEPYFRTIETPPPDYKDGLSRAAFLLPWVSSPEGGGMASKLILSRTRLEEAAAQLRELLTAEEYDSDARLRLVTALGYIDKAVDVLRRYAEQGPGGE
jgi:hypothetical protein